MLRANENVKRPWKELLPSVDPETRYMDLSVGCNLENWERMSVFVFAGCSDGYLR